MLKSNFLSVPELAVRWQQTERQIIEHAISKQLPLLFVYDGLAFDINDVWHRETGHEFTSAKRDYENLCQNVDRMTELLKINAMVRRGQYTPGEFEPYPLSPEEIKKYRAEIDADAIKRDELQERLNRRERERFKYDYCGYMRVMPLTLHEIEINNKTLFPLMAYDPRYKCEFKEIDGHCILDGKIMALERTTGESRLKPFLSISDLLAPTEVIEAIEDAKTMDNVLFHHELVDRELGSNLFYVPDLQQWLKTKRLHLQTEPPFDRFEFVQVEALLCAIERPLYTLTHEQATGLATKDARIKADERLTAVPGWVLASNAHATWRKAFEVAISAGELVLLDFVSKMPIQCDAIVENTSVIKPIPRQRAQESLILEIIKQLGYEPTALPQRVKGKPWVKAEVWGKAQNSNGMFSTKGVFNKAWDRLRWNKEIKEVSP